MSKYIVAMVGARRDFDVAKILFKNKQLQQLFVDTSYNDTSLLARLPFAGKLLNKLKKYSTGIDPKQVSSDWIGAFSMRFLLKYASKTRAYKLANKRLGKNTIRYCENISPAAYYGFDTSSLEFMQWASSKEWKLVLEQCVAPRASQINMYRTFEQKYGLNYQSNIEHCLFQQHREEKEWQLAHTIIVPSLYVKNELLKTNLVDAEKIKIVPFGYTNPIPQSEIVELINQKEISNKPIQILFAGNAGYRKGIIDIIEIAQKLSSENVLFKIAGHLEAEAIDYLNSNKNDKLKYLGKLNKKELVQEYKTSDIFFFPSYLEGSAMVLLEAMSWGLPIVTTYQSGSLVEEGINGFVSEAGEIDAIIFNIKKLITNDTLRNSMSMQSLHISSLYSIEQYELKLLEVLNA
jgi:glycosyltransferase involved in cell wall biosynthesis